MWNGCEICHPDIFAGGKRRLTKYTVNEINEGSSAVSATAQSPFRRRPATGVIRKERPERQGEIGYVKEGQLVD